MAQIWKYVAIFQFHFAFIALSGILYHQELDKQDY